ncbi:MAG: hypothetical protein KC635_08055 [Myxococcales bacterium]|nr:hypothetical protein [Myxococcales bacterium]
MNNAVICVALGGAFLLASACGETAAPVGPTGSVAVAIGALDLPGITDACWDIEVVNGGGQRVFATRITSRGYGDGAGDVSYVGTCDASDGVDDNEVRLDLVGIYDGAATCAAGFVDGDDLDGGSEPFVDTFGVMSQGVPCAPNADAQVQFDVTVLRPANQGFFDVAVNFDNIFCSAKFDCCHDDDASGTCTAGEEIELLSNPFKDGVRDTTVILGFACTAGVDGANTTLLMDDIVVDCDSGARATIHPGGPNGNLYGTAYVDDPYGLLFEVSVYRGDEQLGFDKRYWNVALGLDAEGLADDECTVNTVMTADDGDRVGGADESYIAAGKVYPYIAIDVDLWSSGLACAEEGLDTGVGVSTAYTFTSDTEPTCFDSSYPEVTPNEVCAGPTALPMQVVCLQDPNETEWLMVHTEVAVTNSPTTYTVFADAATGAILGTTSEVYADQSAHTGSFCNGVRTDIIGTSTEFVVAVVQAPSGAFALCAPGANLDQFTIIAISPPTVGSQCVS